MQESAQLYITEAHHIQETIYFSEPAFYFLLHISPSYFHITHANPDKSVAS